MSARPYLKFWVSDFISDTIHLTTTETGAYLKMLLAAWRSPDCTLRNDEKILKRICLLNNGQWRNSMEVLLDFWTPCENKDGYIYQKRLMEEFKAAEKRHTTSSMAGKKSSLRNVSERDSETVPSDSLKGDKLLKNNNTGLASVEHPLSIRSTKGQPYYSHSYISNISNNITRYKDIKDKGRSDDAAFFDFGKKLLGEKAGGYLARLKKAVGIERGMKVLADAEQKQDPREYIGAVIRNNQSEVIDYDKIQERLP